MQPDPKSGPPPSAGPVAAVYAFMSSEAAPGILLMAAAAAALALANSPAATLYQTALETPLGFASHRLSLLHWVNDGLMAIFFLLVGLEIKREMMVGSLSSFKSAGLPIFAAVGGMLVPALVYIGFNWNTPANFRGWAVPAATDIAFALGLLAILGSRVPASLKIFLTALAIIDDLGAIVVIAAFYTAQLSVPALGLAAVGLAVLFAINRLGVVRLTPYLLIGVLVWAAVLASGVHATLAGVGIALTIPLKGTARPDGHSPLERLEHALAPWVAYGVLPVFGLANAGLSLAGFSARSLAEPLPLGIAAGLFVGKQVGIMAAAGAATRLGWAEWPQGARLIQVYGVAVLCGIGFTMSLFIGGLAFAAEALQNQVKLGVFVGSGIAALTGFLILRFSGSR